MEKKLWLKNKDIGENLDVKNVYHLIDKKIKGKFNKTYNPTKRQIKEYKRHGSELITYTHGKIVNICTVYALSSNISSFDFL